MRSQRKSEGSKSHKKSASEEDLDRETRLDEALGDTFPASDPVSSEHSEHAGVPPKHKSSAKKPAAKKRRPS